MKSTPSPVFLIEKNYIDKVHVETAKSQPPLNFGIGTTPCQIYFFTFKQFIMKGLLKSFHRSKKGNRVFVFTVQGTDAELAAYAEAQGNNLRRENAEDDTSAPLYFTSYPPASIRKKGDVIDLMITENGNVVIDSMEEELRRAQLENDMRVKTRIKMEEKHKFMLTLGVNTATVGEEENALFN